MKVGRRWTINGGRFDSDFQSQLSSFEKRGDVDKSRLAMTSEAHFPKNGKKQRENVLKMPTRGKEMANNNNLKNQTLRTNEKNESC